MDEGDPVRVVDDILSILEFDFETVHLSKGVLEEVERGQVGVVLLGQVDPQLVDEIE